MDFNNKTTNPKQYVKGLSQEILDIIGTEIRRKRISKKQNLEDADCTCSISYLSKLERGKIRPSYKYLEELCDANGINLSDLESLMKINDTIEKLIKYYSRGLDDEIRDIHLNLHCFNNYKSEIVSLFYYLVEQDYEMIKRKLNVICIGNDKFTDFDQNIINYFNMVMLNHNHKPIDAYELFFETKTDDKYLKGLLLLELTKAVQDSGIDDEETYVKTLLANSEFLSQERINPVINKHLNYLIDNGIEMDEIELKTYPNEVGSHYYLKTGKTIDGIEVSNKDMAIYLASHGNTFEANEIIKRVTLDEITELTVQYYTLKYTLTHYDSMKFLGEVLIPTLLKNQDLINTKKYLDELQTYGCLAKKQKYVANISTSLLKEMERKRDVRPII